MYRGVVIEPKQFKPWNAPDGTIQELLGWGVNFVRLHMVDSQWYTDDEEAGAAIEILEEARRTDTEGKIKFMPNIRYQQSWDYARHLDFWRRWAPVFETYDSVIGYDVVNEPRSIPMVQRSPLPWLQAMPWLRSGMRELTDRVLMFQSGDGGRDSGFEFLEPFGDPNIWYGCNIWSTQTFTHQGIDGYPTPVEWPSEGNDAWQIIIEKERLIRWSQDHPDETIYIPEIGVSGMADLGSANRWADDALNLIEALGWHATAHSYPARPRSDDPSYNVFHMPLDRYKAWWALNDEG